MKKISELIQKEEERQRQTLMMIPSENYTWPEVKRALGSCLGQKYSEGYPGKRYYQGNAFIDQIELLTQKLALKAFGLNSKSWAVNVQAHSGSIANLAVYNGLVEPGQPIMAMHLFHGGHLSHGWHSPTNKLTLSSKAWDFHFYGVDKETKLLDYEEIEKQAKKIKPKMIVSGGTAYPREIDHQKLGKIAKSVGAYYLADVAHEAGLIAGGANSSPFVNADVVTMTTQKTLRGPRGAIIFSRQELAERIDRAVFPGLQGGPHNHTIAGIAVALEKATHKEFANYAKQTVANAQRLSTVFRKTGLNLVSGGTDKHLLLIDLRSLGLAGPFLANALELAGIVSNYNTVPFDTGSPMFPSGLRLGTPALTVRGMKEAEMELIAGWILEVIKMLENKGLTQKDDLPDFKNKMADNKLIREVSQKVEELCLRFPIPE
ncbi:MAG: serine hydroxymethyltransferase [Patescibacteria group bacterium]